MSVGHGNVALVAVACAAVVAALTLAGLLAQGSAPRETAPDDAGGQPAEPARPYESESAGSVLVPAGYPHPETVGLAGAGVDPDDLEAWEGPNDVRSADMPDDGPLVIEDARLSHLRALGDDVEVICRRCLIGPGATLWGAQAQDGAELIIEDSDILYEGQGRAVRDSGGDGITIRRSVVTGGGTVMNVGDNTLIEETFAADPTEDIDGAHYDVIQTNVGSGITIRGSTVLGRWEAQTSALFLQGHDNWSGLSDVTVEGNFLSGGNYTLYMGAGDDQDPVTRAIIRDNLFNAESWQYGPLRIQNLAGDLVWEGNRTTEGEPVNP